MKTQPFSLSRLAVWILASVLLLGARTAPAENVEETLERERRQQTGTAITIVFDNSGSMNEENKLVQAKAAFSSWLKTIPDDYKLSLITFENNGTIKVPLSEGQKERIAAQVAALKASTNTPICSSLHLASKQIARRRNEVTPYERHVVLIFTDGEENADRRGIPGVQQDIRALRASNIEVVGIGFHGQGDYMGAVATRYCNASDENELRRGLSTVDAEIGSGDDLVVTPQDLEAMKQPVKARKSSRAVADLPAGTAAPSSKAPFGLGRMIVVVTALVLFRAFIKRFSGK